MEDRARPASRAGPIRSTRGRAGRRGDAAASRSPPARLPRARPHAIQCAPALALARARGSELAATARRTRRPARAPLGGRRVRDQPRAPRHGLRRSPRSRCGWPRRYARAWSRGILLARQPRRARRARRDRLRDGRRYIDRRALAWRIGDGRLGRAGRERRSATRRRRCARGMRSASHRAACCSSSRYREVGSGWPCPGRPFGGEPAPARGATLGRVRSAWRMSASPRSRSSLVVGVRAALARCSRSTLLAAAKRA